LRRLQARSLAALAGLAPLLDSRAADGHVRYCHGDLHLANICLWNGRPTLFDCLEFDPNWPPAMCCMIWPSC
jgi:aminoglycoside phosphotransferase family enzyme